MQTAENAEDVFMSGFFAIFEFAPIFLFCEFGERISIETEEAYNELLRCNWFIFPMIVRKILPIIIIGNEKPLGIEGFGNIKCTREAFKKVRFHAYLN